MGKTFQSFDDAGAWHERYGPLAPREGDMAPGFELRDTSGENPVRLSEFAGRKPVALVFWELHLTTFRQGGREPPRPVRAVS